MGGPPWDSPSHSRAQLWHRLTPPLCQGLVGEYGVGDTPIPPPQHRASSMHWGSQVLGRGGHPGPRGLGLHQTGLRKVYLLDSLFSCVHGGFSCPAL